MGICGACGGQGYATCPICHGKKVVTRPQRDGGLDISPCGGCGGTGRSRCQFCGGSGQLPTGTSGGYPSGTPVDPDNPLAGRWTTSGGSWTLTARGNGVYDLIETGAAGQTGSGTAQQTGEDVSVTIKNVLLGTTNYALKYDGKRLSGSLKIMGMSVPLEFRRE